MTLLNFLLTVLAVYRLTYLFVYEDAPFDVMIYVRGWLFNNLGEESWLWRGVNCPYCVSFWLSLFALFVWFNPLAWLGTAGAVMLIFQATKPKEV